METRANFVLIGAFTLAGLFGLLGFLLWFAQVELDRAFAYYDVKFDTVSGLGRASDVRFSGLPVGQVVQVGLAPERDGTVLVRLEVGADTPVRADSVATIEAQGVTGVSFVAISAGTPGEPLLSEVADVGIPRIEAGRSVLQTLTEEAPALLGELLVVAQRLTELLGEDNAARVETILTNLEASSNSFASAMDDFSALTDSISTAAQDIAVFTRSLDGVGEALVTALDRAEDSFDAVVSLSERTEVTLAAGDAMLAEARTAFAEASRFMAEDLGAIGADLRVTTADLRDRVESLGAAAETTLASFSDAGRAATDRLTQAEGTLVAAEDGFAQLQAALATLEGTAARLDALLDGEGARLVAAGADLAERARGTLDATDAALADAGRAFAGAERFVTQELPGLADDLRATTAALRAQITALGDEAGTLLAEFRGTGTAVNARLAEAQATLAAADAMFDEVSAATQTVGRTADRLDTMLATDGAAILSDARAAIARAGSAVDSVAALAETDLPAMMADIRAAAARARIAVDDIALAATSAASRVGPLADSAEATLATVADTFANANATLTAIEGAMDTGQRALDAAERTFEGADRIIREDVAAIAAGLRQSMERLDIALAQISADLPAVTADLRTAAAAASEAFEEFQAVVAATGTPLQAFASQGLAQYSRLAQETRGLVENFDRLIRQIERDPARFFLSRQAPEFRR